MDDKPSYKKPFLTYPEQIDLLRGRGLAIEDENKALHLLEKISYYRLSGYWHILLEDKENHIFKAGASFDIAFQIYCFDKDLRKLFIAEIEKIEIAIRAKIIHVMAENFGPFWMQDSSIFPKKEGYDEVQKAISKEYGRCEETFIDAFRLKYSDDLPPCWMLMEVTSFGTLSLIYKHLKHGKSKRAIAELFGLDDNTFESWLHSIVYVRNICAHHSRLWNRVLKVRPKKAETEYLWLENPDVSNARIFYFASIIIYMLNVINPNHTFKQKTFTLLNNNPNLDYNRMGFSDGWQNEPLWAI